MMNEIRWMRIAASVPLLAALCAGAGLAQARGIQTDSPLNTVSCAITFDGSAITFNPGVGGSPSCVSTTATEAVNHIPTDIAGEESTLNIPIWENWPAGSDSDASEQVEIWTLDNGDLAFYFNYSQDLTCGTGDTATFAIAGGSSYSLANACANLQPLTADAFTFELSEGSSGISVLNPDNFTTGSGTGGGGSTGVPEPASLALLMLGLAGFVATRRRKATGR